MTLKDLYNGIDYLQIGRSSRGSDFILSTRLTQKKKKKKKYIYIYIYI